MNVPAREPLGLSSSQRVLTHFVGPAVRTRRVMITIFCKPVRRSCLMFSAAPVSELRRKATPEAEPAAGVRRKRRGKDRERDVEQLEEWCLLRFECYLSRAPQSARGRDTMRVDLAVPRDQLPGGLPLLLREQRLLRNALQEALVAQSGYNLVPLAIGVIDLA